MSGQLVAAFRGQPHARALLVNDASPDPRIADLVRELAAGKSVRLIENERNLGFVDSVNLAFSKVTEGDVILLNADTIVPDGFMTRLRSAARAFPDIGTVVPLSNNGEFTSFPMPNTPKPAGSPQDIDALDAAAAVVNRDKISISQTALDFVFTSPGNAWTLQVHFRIVRARISGGRRFLPVGTGTGFSQLRAVVYVGHAGSRSFGDEKRALVMRNIGKLETR